MAWWSGPPKGAADVLSVISEDQQINLRYATSTPPEEGQLLRIYPPQYLEALKNTWLDRQWATECVRWLEEYPDNRTFGNLCVEIPSQFDWLRPAQRGAFELPRWRSSYLWGPPGTGKTTTLGALLASLLLSAPDSRILLLSTTNNATDLALVAVDRALEQLAIDSSARRTTQLNCFRLGNHFRAIHYKGREHLIPTSDEGLVKRLIEHEEHRPEPSRVQAYGQWKAELECLRETIRRHSLGVLAHSQLAAMTTTLAVFWFKELRQYKFDLIVFDEASQVGQAYAVAIAPLCRSVLFAGDPKQLSPIVRSEHSEATKWLGKSMFEHMDHESKSVCFLDEQSRMSPPICRLVSSIFYQDRLRVATGCIDNDAWCRERGVHPSNLKTQRHLLIFPVDGDGKWSQKYHGPIRYESAEATAELVALLIDRANTDQEQIVVLTPFRAQRTLIRVFLKNHGFGRVDVSTVHRAQGGERHTVIFDPVDGTNDFLKTEDAPRLINVALSRAQARLILMLSPQDRKNSLLNRIAKKIEDWTKADS